MTGKELTKSFESCRLHAYLDSGKPPVATIGYGTTTYHDGRKVKLGDEITEEIAEYEFNYYFDKMEARLRKEILYPDLLSENQWAALCSLVYNIGSSGFEHSTILKKLNSLSPLVAPKDWFDDLANEITKWCHDNGRVVAGLVNRREKEKEVFLS